MNLKNISKFGIKLIVSAFLLYSIVKDVAFNDILDAIRSADFLTLILAFSLHGIGTAVIAIRWQGLLKSQNIESKIGYLVKSYLVANFFNHFLPSTVGGDSVRAYDCWKLGDNKTKALAVVVVDRFMGLLILLLFVIVSAFFTNEILNHVPILWIWIVTLSFGAILIIEFLLFPPLKLFEVIIKNNNSAIRKVGSIFYKFGDACSQFKNDKTTIIRGMLLSLILQITVVIFYYLISISLDLNVPFYTFFLVIPLTIFIMMLPVSVNGIGLRENTLFFFFSFYGVLKPQAIAFAWVVYGMLLVFGIIGGLVYLFRK